VAKRPRIDAALNDADSLHAHFLATNAVALDACKKIEAMCDPKLNWRKIRVVMFPVICSLQYNLGDEVIRHKAMLAIRFGHVEHEVPVLTDLMLAHTFPVQTTSIPGNGVIYHDCVSSWELCKPDAERESLVAYTEEASHRLTHFIDQYNTRAALIEKVRNRYGIDPDARSATFSCRRMLRKVHIDAADTDEDQRIIADMLIDICYPLIEAGGAVVVEKKASSDDESSEDDDSSGSD
jgi:hypothetical protein